jgi:uncharacterized protein YjiS (DUF1127 family)
MRQFDRAYHNRAGAQATPSQELVGIARNRFRRLRQRRPLRQMLSYGDHTLADVGHCRSTLSRTLHRPMSETPAVQNIHLQNMHPERPRMRY